MKAVGFDQKIQLAHLNITANLLRQHASKDMYNLLNTELMTSIKGDKSRKNAITMLMKTWSLIPPIIKDLRNQLLLEYPYLTASEKRLANYCLTCIAYPFFREQMYYIGKQLKMSDEVYSKLIVSEMKNRYGDRRRVEVAAGAVFSSAKDWQLLTMRKPGVYQENKFEIDIQNPILKALIIEVLMMHYEASIVSTDIVNSSAIFFPFDYHIRIGDLDQQRFTIIKNIRDTIIERNPKIPYSRPE
ncbi:MULTISPECIES: hypothetical protein [Bacillus cereus group]|uniref:hypothetical protein n=1 Tax=Bacillus cereus group TaxID=86661 RepID=UPI000BEC5853|nr:hypothetical protein [Bacillus toyonensis]MBJ8118463.1 hypothetical protein [Bacillus cereus]PEB29155.1 hypothetical protein COO14_16600 [Bacillus toyonensis]HDR7918703.1 hypothetical protein [Bacillus toyonensis]